MLRQGINNFIKKNPAEKDSMDLKGKEKTKSGLLLPKGIYPSLTLLEFHSTAQSELKDS